jgi:hypothetical protein
MHHTTVEIIILAIIPIIGIFGSTWIIKNKRIPVRIKSQDEQYRQQERR